MRNVLVVALTSIIILAGCGGPAETQDAQTMAAAEPNPHEEHDHVHAAPHGGLLIPLGDHQANLEVMFLPAEGRVTLYLLDAHAENPVRSTAQAISLKAIVPGGSEESVELLAVANALTGEIVGDTSEFAGASEALRGATAFTGVLPKVSLMGQDFTDIQFEYHP